VALLIPISYPGRQVFDVIWAIVPLWGLAALALSHQIQKSQNQIVSVTLAGAIFMLLVLFWLVSLNLLPGTPTWLILVVVPLLIILTTALVGMGWSWETGQRGLAWGTGAALSVLVLAATFGVSQMRPNSAREFWSPTPATVQAVLLENTLKELAVTQNGREDELDILSLVDSPSLRWVLRVFQNVKFSTNLNSTIFPTILITTEVDQNYPQLFSYRGQDFLWFEYPGWDSALPLAWFDWVTSREAPVVTEWLVVWARSDLFPDDSIVEPGVVDIPTEDGEDID
jgi:hypothetical protein